MYIVRLLNSNNHIDIISTKILYDSYDEIKVLVKDESLNSDSLLGYDRFHISVKNNYGFASFIMSDNVKNLSVDNHIISIKRLKNIGEDEIFENQVFKNINLFFEQKHRLWVGLDEKEKFQWLRSCYYYNRSHEYYNNSLVIDGQFIKSKNDFLCEFLEKLVGVGAYFGSDLDGFDDCFDIYQIKNVQLEWENYKDFEYIDIIVDILMDRGVEILIT